MTVLQAIGLAFSFFLMALGFLDPGTITSLKGF